MAYYTRRSGSSNENKPWSDQKPQQIQPSPQSQFRLPKPAPTFTNNFVKSFQVDNTLGKDNSNSASGSLGTNVMNSDMVNKLKSQPPPPPPPDSVVVDNSNNIVEHDDDAKVEMKKSRKEHFQQLKEARKKAGLLGKIDKKLRKRRLNARLEKVLRPKNAFLIFNELNLKPQYETQEISSSYPKMYLAQLTLDGQKYIGEGPSINIAKSYAADAALKDWFVRACKKNEIADNNTTKMEESSNQENEPAPWSAVGSYAMHLLFTRWKMNTPTPAVLSTSEENISTNGVNKVEPPQSGELVNYQSPEQLRIPSNPEQCHPLYVFNLTFPNVPFVQECNEMSSDERYRLRCQINGTVYEAIARGKKEAKRQIAMQVLQHFKIGFLHQ